MIWVFVQVLVTVLAGAAATYALIALWVINRTQKVSGVQVRDVVSELRPVSVLKPLHGAESGLFENLSGFCRQTHADYELVFGVQDPNDPAISVVERLRQTFPQVSVRLVIDSRVHGTNRKVSNLINILARAQHDWLVLADSDISVPPDYLVRVTAPLLDADVGIVTCLYHGIPVIGFWPRLGRLFIDDWFAPSVRLAHAFGSTRFAFGSTIALHRETLDAIGGFTTLRDTLADDFWLGELTRQHGLRTVLSDLVVGTQVGETNFSELWSHELRWLRTIRAIAPLGFAMTFVCFTTPWLLLGLILAPSPFTAGFVFVGGSARVLLYFLQRRRMRVTLPWHDVLLIPLRDFLLFAQWAVALLGWRVTWRGRELDARATDHQV